MGAQGRDWWPGLPALPTEDEARAVLAGWARRQRLAPNTLFDGPLVVEDASVVWMAVDRLLETRTETAARVPGRLGERPTYDDLQRVRLDGEEWQERDWHGVGNGSVRETVCQTCGGGAWMVCGTCQGQSQVRCPKKVACPRCGGTGWVDVGRGPPGTCPACRGSRLQWCPHCKGIGKRACTNPSCVGGRVACTSCEQTGRFTSYKAGRIRRWVDHRVVEAGEGRAALEPADRGQAQLLLAAEQSPDLSAVPPHLLTELAGELGWRPAGELGRELGRRVRLFLLPVVMVRYRDAGALQTAYLIGPTRRVHAPDAKGLRRLFRARWGGRRR